MTVYRLLEDIQAHDILCKSSTFDDTLPCTSPCRDSRRIQPGDVFFCIRGPQFDGHTALSDAAHRGAVCAVLEDPAAGDTCPIPWIAVRDTAAAFLSACLAQNGHPERGMTLIAVTGTNGKTSVTYMLEAIFRHAGHRCAVFGTVENRIDGTVFPSGNTTPAPELLARQLRLAREKNVSTVLMEVSSHALAQRRLSGLHFEYGIFTNLTEDHLDYHRTMEDYFSSKRQLFLSCNTMLVNADDPAGVRLLADPALPDARYAVTPYSDTGDYTAAYLPQDLRLGCCDFVAANRLLAAVCANLAGISADTAFAALRTMPPIPGRMECIRKTPTSVYIDYAHTPDALTRALRSLRAQNMPGTRLLVLFGCGGDREREKRPKMGAIAASCADLAVITADNSRSEDVRDIIADILSGVMPAQRGKCRVVCDRRDAIYEILSLAAPGDCVLLAGKGHETSQTDRLGTHPFSERGTVDAYFETHGILP